MENSTGFFFVQGFLLINKLLIVYLDTFKNVVEAYNFCLLNCFTDLIFYDPSAATSTLCYK